MRALLVLLAGCASPLSTGTADLAIPVDAAAPPDLARPDLELAPGACKSVADCPPPAHGAAACTSGRCVAACDPGFGDCDGDFADGCEADFAGDAKNCGACGTACASGRCGSFIAASFAQQPVDWTFNGSARWDGTSLSGVLTDAANSLAGTIVYSAPVVIDEFDLTFSFQIGGGSGADGMAFAVSGAGATSLGGGGGALGVASLPGWGVELDTYDNNNGACGDSDGNHVAVDDLAACGMGQPTSLAVAPAPFALRDTGAHAAHVVLKNGLVTVSLDGQLVLDSVALPGFQAGQQRWLLFGAGTGGLNDRHEVRNVAIQFPSPRCL